MEETALHLAAENGHPAVCELLINRGADIDAQDQVVCTCVLRHIFSNVCLETIADSYGAILYWFST
jgi:ankyrin repeat protein